MRGAPPKPDTVAGTALVATIRRARPLLGTIVEITARGSAAAQAVAQAFSAIARVHARMSFHDPESELSRLNREAHRGPIRVSPGLWKVLTHAQQLSRASDGVFDLTVATRLVTTGFLPRLGPAAALTASWQDVVLNPGRHVRFARPLQLDLGGIAKGHAIDLAIDALRASGADSGCVNAGGDLRVFGPEAIPVQIRHPARPSVMARTLLLQEGAAATSARYFSARRYRGEEVSPLLDGRTRRCCDEGCSATVIAPSAMMADALTKVVLALREKARPILARHGASAFLLDPRGRCTTLGADFADAP